jgi:tRNA(Leu) C34 or U34 (ribose-2'-O)-methylase TrmL
VLGSETEGLPALILGRFAEYTYRILINEDIRSLNLSTAVGIAF